MGQNYAPERTVFEELDQYKLKYKMHAVLLLSDVLTDWTLPSLLLIKSVTLVSSLSRRDVT